MTFQRTPVLTNLSATKTAGTAQSGSANPCVLRGLFLLVKPIATTPRAYFNSSSRSACLMLSLVIASGVRSVICCFGFVPDLR